VDRSGAVGAVVLGLLLEEEGGAADDGEDRGLVAAESAVEETLLQGEARRRLG